MENKISALPHELVHCQLEEGKGLVTGYAMNPSGRLSRLCCPNMDQDVSVPILDLQYRLTALVC